MDKKALQLGSRFAFKPNSLGYCGRQSAILKSEQCVILGKCDGVEEEFENFVALNPYLETLATVLNLSKFSYSVVEAYWLGNSNLSKININDYQLLINNFKKQGIPDFLISDLQEKIPKRFIPFHLFQVLHVGVGRASGSVPFNIQSINSCMIRWGKVLSVNQQSAIVELNSLRKEKDSYEIYLKKEKVFFDEKFIKSLKTGDIIAVHWKMVTKILTKKEVTNLSFWTKEVLKNLI